MRSMRCRRPTAAGRALATPACSAKASSPACGDAGSRASDILFFPMPDISDQVDIPNRALFKAAEVCDLAKVQPYVLRSWEAEFPDLGVARSAGSPRVYRRADVAQ